MVVNLISFPFRIGGDGSVATVQMNSDQGVAEELAVMALTETGERELVPNFGITDPVFNTFDAGEFKAKVSLFKIPAQITDVVGKAKNSNTLGYDIAFEVIATDTGVITEDDDFETDYSDDDV